MSTKLDWRMLFSVFLLHVIALAALYMYLKSPTPHTKAKPIKVALLRGTPKQAELKPVDSPESQANKPPTKPKTQKQPQPKPKQPKPKQPKQKQPQKPVSKPRKQPNKTVKKGPEKAKQPPKKKYRSAADILKTGTTVATDTERQDHRTHNQQSHSNLDPSEFKKHIKSGPKASSAASRNYTESQYRDILREYIRGKWRPPSRSQVPAGEYVVIHVQVLSNGSFIVKRITHRSSNNALNYSVQQLLPRLQKAPPFKTGMGSSYSCDVKLEIH